MANTSLVNAFAFLFISGAGIMWSMDGQCCSTGTLEDTKEVCCFNFYKNGSVCKACPAGYYGTNCNVVCPPSLYGLGCKQSCDCTSCHHIYGCITFTITTACPAGYYGTNCNEVCPPSLYGLGCKQRCNCTSCHHIYGCITSPYTKETPSYENDAEYNNSTQIQISRKNIGRILIISAGSVISLTLMLIILHEVVTYRQIHAQNDVHQVVHVYDDIGVL